MHSEIKVAHSELTCQYPLIVGVTHNTQTHTFTLSAKIQKPILADGVIHQVLAAGLADRASGRGQISTGTRG